MSPASSRATRSTVPDDRILELREDSSSFSDDIPSCSGASGLSNNSDENEFNNERSAAIERTHEDESTTQRVVRKVKLKPDFRGIGITIAGGVYTPWRPELLPVFITGVDPEGPASLTQQIKVMYISGNPLPPPHVREENTK